MNNNKEAYDRLAEHGIKPSVQRLAIMQYLLTHRTHPTVEEVYAALVPEVPTLSRTTVYNTLRMFSEKNAAQMITVDEHRVCYDGDISRHAHFYCKSCHRIIDVFDTVAFPPVPRDIAGNEVGDVQVYLKGICAGCKP
jgi:Fur family transcriptional regulator, peroxide stress response regulator